MVFLICFAEIIDNYSENTALCYIYFVPPENLS